MTTGVLEQSGLYDKGDYEYGGGKGLDTNGNGKKEIDCSTLVWKMLNGAGYNIPYHTTSVLNGNVTHYDVIEWANVLPGDIAVWASHTGFVVTADIANRKGTFFGSQSSTGPAPASFGAGANYWRMPGRFLRVKEQYKTGAQPAPAPAAAPAPAPAAPAASALMNFQYPIRKADGKQFTDAEELYKGLEGETSGHYLLGSNKFWHGGIHISDKSAPQCKLNEPVRCMADGEVVAYRLNQDYLQSTFGDNEKKLKYSNSFCLVRHEYKSAPNPEEGANKGKQNKLNFYSLYMHLLPHARYPLAPEETPAKKVTMKVGDFNAYPTAPPPGVVSQPDGKLVNGTRLEILETAESGELTYAKGKILSGSVKKGAAKTHGVGDAVWFAYLKNGEPYKNSLDTQIWKEELVPERLRPNYWQGKVKAKVVKRLPLYEAPANPTNGQPAGSPKGTLQLSVDSVIEFDSKAVLNLAVGNQIMRMASCTLVSGGLWGDGVTPTTFWACVENVVPNKYLSWDTVTPSEFDSVVATGTGIKAGDPIGYLGLTENLTGEDGGVTNKYQVHVEIFTAEADVKDFLKNVAGLKIGKQYLHLAAGAELKKKAPATGSIPVKKEHAVDLSKAPVIKEGDENWYDVSVVEDDQPLKGLVKKAGATLITQHDWEKLGFQIVEETNAVADGFLDPEDMPQFFKDLFAKIDKNHDGNVDPGELAEALKNADTRDHWAKLIAHHPTEWKDKAESAKWSKLDTLLETSPKTLKHEKERISKYVFWSELSGKAAVSSDVVWHFHPIEFISNMTAKKTCECNAVVKATRWVSSTMTHYGPLHTGDKELGSAPQWDELVSGGRITADEKKIIVVMSGNEAKINGVQCYDSEVITAGAMQKTVKVSGAGELPVQIKKFKDQYPDAYVEFFESKGWKLDETGTAPKLYYQGEARANGAKLEGQALKDNLQLGCSEATFGKVVDCQPVSVMACAIASPLYVEIQIMDFIDRLHSALGKVPTGYSFSAEKLFKSPLGKAVILDHDINRPANVKDDLGSALDTFFAQNPAVSRNVDTWGAAHGTNEQKVLDLYGNNRRMTNPSLRYTHLKAGL